MPGFSGRAEEYRGGVPAHGARDAEPDELADAVLDVHPEPAERLHQRVGIETFFRPGAQITKDAGAKRALDKVSEPGIQITLGFGTGGRRRSAS